MSAKGFAVITGASKGIGKCIAIELATKGYSLLLIARSENELAALANSLESNYKVLVRYLAIDLSEPDAAQKVFNYCMEQGYSNIRILVNNAGYGLWGNFEELPLQKQEEMMHVNVNTLVKLSHYFLPVLKKNKPGYILNVSSTAAYQAVPTLAIYAASKAFVLSFSRALKYELRNSSVSVTCLCPGPVNTNFVDRAGMQAIKAKAEKFGMIPEKVASIAIKGMFKGKAEIVPGFLNVATAFLVQFFPKKITEKIAADIYVTK